MGDSIMECSKQTVFMQDLLVCGGIEQGFVEQGLDYRVRTVGVELQK